jgi:H+/gluconate symporter-like permease
MFASVTSVSIAVLTVVTPPTIANVAPPPPPLLTGAVAPVETSGSLGIIVGVIVGVIIALVLALVFMRRRRHLNEKRRKNGGLQVPNGREAQHDGLQVPNVREAQQDEKGAAARRANAESADEMAAPEPKPTGATKAPEAPKLPLAVEEGLELQNTPLVSSFLGMFSPKFEGVQNVQEGEQQV